MQRIISSFTRLELRLVVFCATMVAVGTFVLATFRSSDPLQSLPEDARFPDVTENVAKDSQGVDTNGRVCLNTANEAALESLPGIGPARAKQILALRESKGGFTNIQELLEINGLGEKSYLKLSPHITLTTVPVRSAETNTQMGASGAAALSGGANRSVESATPTNNTVAPARPMTTLAPTPVAIAPVAAASVAAPESIPTNSAQVVTRSTVNINTATAAELETLNGVGPALAQRIIEFRTQQGGFRTVGDLDLVKGIGPAVLRKNAGIIIVR